MPDILDILNQLRFKRALGLPPPNPLEPEPEVDDSLYADPASLDAFRTHALNPPQRQAPSKRDSGLAALSGFLQSRDNPRIDQYSAMQKILNQPYDNAVQDYEIRGKGLGNAVGAEEISLNRKRLGTQRREEIGYRKEQARNANEDRDLERGRRSTEERTRAEDRDLDRTSREEIARENRENNAALRRDLASNRPTPPEKLTDVYDPELMENTKVPLSEASGKIPKIGGREIEKERFLSKSETDLNYALDYLKKNPGAVGNIQGLGSRFKRWADTGPLKNDPELNKVMNILESYRGKSLNTLGGASLTPTELKVYEPVQGMIDQSEGQALTNLEEAIRGIGLMRRTGKKKGTVGKGKPITVGSYPGIVEEEE